MNYTKYQPKTVSPATSRSTDGLGQQDMWFSYDPGDGYATHDTEAEARDRAERALQYYADDAAGEGWSEEVTQIAWGKVIQHVEEKWRKKRPPEEELECGVGKDGTVWGEWVELVDYHLCPNYEGINHEPNPKMP